MEWAMSAFMVVATVTVAGLRWWSGHELDKADHAAGPHGRMDVTTPTT